MIRVQPFDTGTAQGRELERYRRALFSMVSGGGAKATSILSTLILVPAALHHLGGERFGVWITLVSFVLSLSFLDLGIGNGLMIEVAGAAGRGDTRVVQRLISSALPMLAGLSALSFGLMLLAWRLIPSATLFHQQSPDLEQETGHAVIVLFTILSLALPTTLAPRVQAGLQRGARANAWQGLGNGFALVATYLVMRAGGGLAPMITAYVGGPVVAQALNSIHFFVFASPELRPGWKLVDRAAAGRVFDSGAHYFLLQLFTTLAYTSDNILIAHLRGAAAVTPFAVQARLFSPISIFWSLFFVPFTPAYADAIAKGDQDWIRKTLIGSLRLTALGTSSMVLLLLVFAGKLLHVWVGDGVQISGWLLGGLAIWTIQEQCATCVSTMLFGARELRLQVVVAGVFATSCVVAKYLAIDFLGTAAIPWACSAVNFIAVLIPYGLIFNRLVHRRTAIVAE